MFEIKVSDGSTYSYVGPKHYPDGSPLLHQATTSKWPVTMVLRPETLDIFMQAMFYCDASRWRGHPIKKLVIPHIPGGRQDRLNSVGDFGFTLKSIANEINMREFDEVHVFDPHSNVTPALINSVIVHRIEDVINFDGLNRDYGFFDGVVAPDAGAASRAFAVAQEMGVDFYQAEKHRDVATGKLNGFKLDVPAGNYLVVDDICDGGGTFIGLADCVGPEVKLSLFVTHGIFSQGVSSLLKKFDNIFTTNSTTFTRRYSDQPVKIYDILGDFK